MRLLSIDFGTSNTVVALAVDGQAARTVTFDASPLLPSAVYLAADGSVTVGREAQRQARLDPTRYEPNPKRRIDDGEVLLGDRVVGVVELIAAVLRTVATEVRRQLGGAPADEVRLTHPAQWGATRQNTLLSAARAAGLGNNLVLIPEPVAAAAQFTQLPGRTLPPGGSVAIYDLGGGTFDIAVVGRTQSDFHVLAEAGLGDLGGLDFDQAVLDHVGRTTSSTDPSRWQQILRPGDSGSRRAARALAEDVRAAKETLSRYPQTEVALPDPFSDVHLTRPEFEGLIRPNLVRSIEVLQTTLRNAGVGPDRLTGIFLVGGSSRIPLVAKLITEQLGVTPVALDQPETAVALGALLVPVHREGNRTVAFGDTPAGQGPVSAGQRPVGSAPLGPRSTGLTGPSSGGLPSGGFSGPMTTGRTPSGPPSGPHSAPLAGLPGSAASGSKPVSRNGSGKGRWIGAGVAAVVVVIALVLLIVKPFSSNSADPTTTPPTDTSTGASTGASTDQSGASTPPTTGGSSAAGDPNATGVGPQKALTQGELDFLGPAANKLINCGDNTDSINRQVPESYRGTRVLRCTIPQSDNSGLYGTTLVWVITKSDPAAAAALQAQISKDRTADKDYSVQDKGGDVKTGQGTLKVVVSDHLSELGNGSDGDGVPTVSWSLQDKPYVGVLTAVKYSTANDLLDYFTINYQPR